MVQKDDRDRTLSETFVWSSQAPSKLPAMIATIPDRNEPRALARTENHTVDYVSTGLVNNMSRSLKTYTTSK